MNLDKGLFELPYIPEHCTHNAHIFYLKVEDLQTRTALLKHLVYIKKFPIKKPWNGCFRAMKKVALGDLYVKFSFCVPLDNGIE